jgi:hypothetical protein
MAMSTGCQTPGAQFHTHITNRMMTVSVDFGRELNLTEEEAKLLETNAHNQLELAIALTFAVNVIRNET